MDKEVERYRSGEAFRTEYINSESIEVEGCFILLIVGGLLALPLGCDLITRSSTPIEVYLIMGTCTSPFLLLGTLQIAANVLRTKHLDRIMKNARECAVPDLPKAYIGDLHSSAWELLAHDEKGREPEEILQKESDDFLYKHRD